MTQWRAAQAGNGSRYSYDSATDLNSGHISDAWLLVFGRPITGWSPDRFVGWLPLTSGPATSHQRAGCLPPAGPLSHTRQPAGRPVDFADLSVGQSGGTREVKRASFQSVGSRWPVANDFVNACNNGGTWKAGQPRLNNGGIRKSMPEQWWNKKIHAWTMVEDGKPRLNNYAPTITTSYYLNKD